MQLYLHECRMEAKNKLPAYGLPLSLCMSLDKLFMLQSLNIFFFSCTKEKMHCRISASNQIPPSCSIIKRSLFHFSFFSSLSPFLSFFPIRPYFFLPSSFVCFSVGVHIQRQREIYLPTYLYTYTHRDRKKLNIHILLGYTRII